MHEIEPFYNWNKYYEVSEDELSPFYGKEYNMELFSEEIYGYYIHPSWDFMGSETLYLKILFTNYKQGFTIIEFIGEWNDALHNDIMHLKRNVIEHLQFQGVNKFILMGENVLNFHGSDDCYYEEWYEETEDAGGWIVGIGFRDFVLEEWKKYNLDTFINFGGSLDLGNWRTFHPNSFFGQIQQQIGRRIPLT